MRSCAEFLLNLFDPLVAKLQALATQGPVAAGGGSNQTEIQVVEGELAWLVYIIGAVVGARGTSRTSEEHEQLDGDLCARVFQTIQCVEMRQPVQVRLTILTHTPYYLDTHNALCATVRCVVEVMHASRSRCIWPGLLLVT